MIARCLAGYSISPDCLLGGLLGSIESFELDKRSLSVAFLVTVATVCTQN